MPICKHGALHTTAIHQIPHLLVFSQMAITLAHGALMKSLDCMNDLYSKLSAFHISARLERLDFEEEQQSADCEVKDDVSWSR